MVRSLAADHGERSAATDNAGGAGKFALAAVRVMAWQADFEDHWSIFRAWQARSMRYDHDGLRAMQIDTPGLGRAK